IENVTNEVKKLESAWELRSMSLTDIQKEIGKSYHKAWDLIWQEAEAEVCLLPVISLMSTSYEEGPIAENELTADLSVMHESRRFQECIYACIPQIIPYTNTSATRNITPILLFFQLNSLVDSIKFLFSVYTENMIEVFKISENSHYEVYSLSNITTVVLEKKKLMNFEIPDDRTTDYETVELLKSHSCQTPEQRLQKEAENKVESERVAALNTQLESLLQEHSDIVGLKETQTKYSKHRFELYLLYISDPLSPSSAVFTIVLCLVKKYKYEMNLYYRKGVEEEEVHIRTMADPLTGQSDGQKSLLVVPNAVDANKLTDDDDQKKGENKQKMLLLNSTEEDNCLTATFDGSLTDPLQLPFSNAELSQSNNNRNNIQIQTSENTSSLYSQHVSTIANIKVKSIAETTVPASGKKHLRIYQCPECPKSFVKNSNFKQHL
ncbi:hypothetical protein L9F63_018934, partial [Diploptera punctata]